MINLMRMGSATIEVGAGPERSETVIFGDEIVGLGNVVAAPLHKSNSGQLSDNSWTEGLVLILGKVGRRIQVGFDHVVC